MKRMGMSWVWGVVLILLGAGFLANSVGANGVHDFIINWWPLLLIVIGLGEILADRNYFSGAFWVIIGIVVLIFTTGWVSYNGDIWTIIWPVALILIGIRFIFRPSMHTKVDVEDGSFVGSSAVFSGASKKITSKNFRGSNVSAVFGGAKLDLRDATIAKEGAVIGVSAIFGGVEVLVPRKTPVRTDVVAIFGGHDDKRSASDIDEKLPTITVKGEAIFGGIEIKD